MVKVDIIDAKLEHIDYMADLIRRPDIDELLASNNSTPRECMEYGLANGDFTKVLLLDGEPVSIWGVVAYEDNNLLGAPWMVGTKNLEKHAIAFVKQCREQLKKALSNYIMLTNMVDVRNEKSVKWLKWLGFNFLPPEKYGVNGELFQRFYLRRT